MASQSLNVYSPLTRQVKGDIVPIFFKTLGTSDRRQKYGRVILSRSSIICSAVQESSAAVTDKKEAEPAAKAAAPSVQKAPEKPKKPPTKPLPQLMEEDLIPSLKATLEAQEDVSQIELSFHDNRELQCLCEFLRDAITMQYQHWALNNQLDMVSLYAQYISNLHRKGPSTLEGSFLKKDIPYNFWAFFPNGELTGPKAFSLSSYGYEASTVEPFLIDERRVSAQLVVFWIRKRLAAQGILPVWKE